MPTQPSPHPLPHLLDPGFLFSLVSDNERRDGLAVALVGEADYADVCDAGVAEEAVFDFERVDVLAAADDEVFDAAGDFDVAGGVHGAFVAGLMG